MIPGLGHRVQSGRDVHGRRILGGRLGLGRLTVFAFPGDEAALSGAAALSVLSNGLGQGGKDLPESPPAAAWRGGDATAAGRPERATQVISYFKSMASASGATSSGPRRARFPAPVRCAWSSLE